MEGMSEKLALFRKHILLRRDKEATSQGLLRLRAHQQKLGKADERSKPEEEGELLVHPPEVQRLLEEQLTDGEDLEELRRLLGG